MYTAGGEAPASPVASFDAYFEGGHVMTLMRYEPWSLLDQMRREMERSLDTRTAEGSSVATSDWVPAVDIREEDNDFVIVADIPGVDPKDIEVHMDNGVLTIKGEKESEKKEEREGYKRVERTFGSFYRRFGLPDTADPERISANSHNGVLEVRIAKQEKVQPRKIAVNS
jgi:HSP20 family protein